MSGARAEWWDPVRGTKVGELDLVERGRVDEDESEGVSFAPVGRHRVAVTVDTQPVMRIFDVRTGREVDAMSVGTGIVQLVAQEGHPYVVLYPRNRQVEMWGVERERRVLGPFGGSPNANEVFTGRFLDAPGHFLFADPGRLRWYRAGSLAPERTLELGWGGQGQLEDRQPVAVSANGRRVLASRSLEGWTRLLSLDPDDWNDTVCDVVPRRAFTDEELATLPDGIADRLSC